MADSKKEQLVRFLEQRAFKPVLNAKPSGRSEADRKRLAHVQEATEAEIERVHHYGSAAEVVTNFRRDPDSKPAKRGQGERGVPSARGSRFRGKDGVDAA